MGDKGEVFEWAVRRGRRVRVDGGCGAGGGDETGSAEEIKDGKGGGRWIRARGKKGIKRT